MKNRATLEEAERVAVALGRRLKEQMPKGWGFILWLESFGPDGFATYLSTIKREDAIRSLQEWLARMKTTADTSEFVSDTDDSCWCCSGKTALVTLRGPHRSVQVCAQCILSTEKEHGHQ